MRRVKCQVKWILCQSVLRMGASFYRCSEFRYTSRRVARLVLSTYILQIILRHHQRLRLRHHQRLCLHHRYPQRWMIWHAFSPCVSKDAPLHGFCKCPATMSRLI